MAGFVPFLIAAGLATRKPALSLELSVGVVIGSALGFWRARRAHAELARARKRIGDAISGLESFEHRRHS